MVYGHATIPRISLRYVTSGDYRYRERHAATL